MGAEFVIRDTRPEPEYIVRHEAWNRATRRKANRLARKAGGYSVEANTPNRPYRRPFWEKPGRHLARLAELEDRGQLRGRATIEVPDLRR